MITFEGISQQSPIFKKNITTLRLRQPKLAERLSELPMPDHLQYTLGRDGSPVVVLEVDDDRIAWLGGSSMPSVSAVELLSGFVDQGVSVALPSVGTGYECLRLLDRLMSHCAVFVCEERVERLAAVLSVIDYSFPLSSGRLVFLEGDVEQSLPAFIDDHPGYDFPTQLFALPDLDVNAFKVRTDAVHRACRIAGDRHQEQIRQLIRHRKPASRNTKPHIAVVSVDATGGAVEHAGCIERAIKKLSWACSISVPDHPQSCSLVSRVQAISESGLDLILIINGTPGRLADYLPPDVPIACWFMDSATLPTVALEGIEEASHLLAASVEVRDVLTTNGAKPDSVRVVEKGVDDVLFCSDSPTVPRREAVLVLVDGEDLDPDSAHIGLESHGRLWMAMQQSITAATDRRKRLDLPGLLAKAERETGVRLSDDNLRQQFLSIVAQKMTGTITAKTAIQVVVREGIRLELFGRNWAKHTEVAQFHKGVIPEAKERAKLFKHCGCTLLPFVEAGSLQYGLEAIASGCLPIMRIDGSETFNQYPGAKNILQEVPHYGTHSELMASVKKWSSRTQERDELVAGLQSQLLTDHKTSDRVREIRAWVCG